jgi:hypothetical protein
MSHVYEGGCHCGTLRVQVTKSEPISRLIDCNCTICTKKGVLHAAVEDSEFSVLTGLDKAVTYRFGSGAAQHNYCPDCGIHVFGRPRNSPDRYTVNARCLDDFRTILETAKVIPFDGENHPKDRQG